MKVVTATVNKHFEDFIHDWEKDIYLLIGGYGSGKSYTTALKIILLALKEKRKILVVRQVKDTIKESCFEDLVDAIETLDLQDYFTTRTNPLEIRAKNGTKIIFRGLDKASKIKSIKDISAVWIEEASDISEDAYKELKKRLRTKKAKTHMFITTNPSEISHWIAKFIEKRISLEEFYKTRVLECENKNEDYTEKILLHHSTYRDNAFLPPSFISDLKNETNSQWRAIGTDGRFGSHGVKVFENVTELKPEQILKFVMDKYPLIGLDFGFVTSSNALIQCVIDTEFNDLYIFKELYKKGVTDPEFLAEPDMQNIIDNRYIVFADSAEPKAIKLYKDNGVKMNPAEKTANNNMNGVRKMWTFRNIFISPELTPNTHREFTELKFYINADEAVAKNPKNGKIFTFDPHTFDAVNYALSHYKPRKLDKHRYRKEGEDDF